MSNILNTIINNNRQLATLLENTVTHKISQEGLREAIEEHKNLIKYRGIDMKSLRKITDATRNDELARSLSNIHEYLESMNRISQALINYYSQSLK